MFAEDPTGGRTSISPLEGNSDAYLVVNAAHPLSLLDEYTERPALVGRINKAPKLDDSIIHREVDIVIIYPRLGPDVVV